MSTAHSWVEHARRLTRDHVDALRDLGALLAFRGSGLSRSARRKLQFAGGVVLLVTIVAIVLPALLREPLGHRHDGGLVGLLPSVYLGFLVLAVVSAVASGGGREVVPREQAVAFPVSTLTDHFGALLLAPLNIAWLLQTWTLLAVSSYVLGPTNLWASMIPLLLWVALATAIGQLVGWCIEGVRRGRRGVWTVRGIGLVTVGTALGLLLSGRVVGVLDQSPTVRLYLLAVDGVAGAWAVWLGGVAALSISLAAIVLLGGWPAALALHRPPRDEARLDSAQHRPRTDARSDLAAMIRMDRTAVWRSVPFRRGVLVLAVMPGVIAVAGRLSWDLISILPGLVASGGALLFGVNAWCLDGRGALWRESLPVAPQLVFLARAVVLVEVLLGTAAVTVVLGSLRAGPPTSAELGATICAAVVVSVQVTATSIRWSVQRPFATDLRSARATPAPPVVMVGYSARLAGWTTVTGLVFSGLTAAPDWRYPVLIAVSLLCWSGIRLSRTATKWLDPKVRSRVIVTVAG